LASDLGVAELVGVGPVPARRRVTNALPPLRHPERVDDVVGRYRTHNLHVLYIRNETAPPKITGNKLAIRWRTVLTYYCTIRYEMLF